MLPALRSLAALLGACVVSSAQTTFTEAHPIFVNRCNQCHAVVGFGGFDIASPNIAAAYFDSQQPSYWAPGLTKGHAALLRIQNGSMPPNGGCTGNPVLDAGLPTCLTAREQAVLAAWIADGQLGPASTAGVNPQFDLALMVQTGLTMPFLHEVGLDDSGAVVFRGQESQGSGLFVATTPGQFTRLTPIGSGVFEGLALRAGAPAFALTRRRSGTTFTLERWPLDGSATSVVASSPNDFDTPQLGFDVARDGRIAFWAHVGGEQRLLVGFQSPFAVAFSSPIGSGSSFAPSLADDGRVAFRDNAGAIWRADPSSGALTPVASAALGFSSIQGAPQIAHDGASVLFTGDRGFGAGLLLWSDATSPASFLHVAGERLEGFDAGGALTLRDFSSRAGRADASTLRAAFVGSIGGQPRLVATSLRLRGVDTGSPYLGGGALREVVAPGAQIAGATVAALSAQARFNSNGALVCTVALAGGPLAILRATPRVGPDGPARTVRVSFKRLVDSNGKFDARWSTARLERALRRLSEVLEHGNFAGLRLELEGGVVDLADPALALGGPSWRAASPTLLAQYEALALNNASVTGWRSDAVNVYLVDTLSGECTASSFPPGHPCAGGSNEIVMLAPQNCGSNAQDDLALSLGRALGAYFGLAPTFESTCAGAESAGACAFPYLAAPSSLGGDLLRDTPFDPDAAGVGNLGLLSATWGACPPVFELVRRNLLARYSNELERATLTLGQVDALRRAALSQRAHVLAP